MKITICGSMKFADKMLEAKKVLGGDGHEVLVAPDTKLFAQGKQDSDDLETDFKNCQKDDLIRTHFELIDKSDAILVLNYEKNGIMGYIGASTLMEVGVAYFLRKKIFLLNPLPDPSEQRWAHEVSIMEPVVLDDDLNNLS